MANISVIAAILPCALAGKFRSNVVLGDSLQVALMSNSQEWLIICILDKEMLHDFLLKRMKLPFASCSPTVI